MISRRKSPPKHRWFLLFVAMFVVAIIAVAAFFVAELRHDVSIPKGGLVPIPALAPISTSTPTPLPARPPTLLPGLLPTFTQATTPVAALTPVRTRTPVPTSSPPPSPSPVLAIAELRQFMLGLINADRTQNGVAPMVLGDNAAAQKHADEMRLHGYSGHWGLDGMKPYMRYTLTGGSNYEAENTFGVAHTVDDNIYKQTEIKALLQQAQASLMGSPGHRRNILTSTHRKVNLGISYNRSAVWIVQQFEGDYMQFSQLPNINPALGVLQVEGSLNSGHTLSQAIQIWYDPLPAPLTTAQINSTYCYDQGTPVAFIRKPAGPGSLYLENVATYSYSKCLDPHTVPPDAPRPVNVPRVILPVEPLTVTQVPWIDASRWIVSGSTFSLRVDLSGILLKYGKGVYTIRIWGSSAAGTVELTNYSIFIR